MGVKREDAAATTSKDVAEELRAAEWYVYERYELLKGPRGRYVEAPRAVVDRATGKLSPWRWEYAPLVKHDDLFLLLAWWPEKHGLDGGPGADPGELDTDKNAAAAKEWAETYGVLGLTLTSPEGWHSSWAFPEGGEGDTVAGFAAEAWSANRALRLYEAATRAGGVDVETIKPLIPDPVHRASLDRFPEEARGFALNAVMREIWDRRPYYHPALYWPKVPGMLPTGEFVQGWGFTNLLGAIWLQALWLLTAGPDSVKKCAYWRCNRVITYAQPAKPSDQKKGERKPYKTRRDIHYCKPEITGRYCRQNAAKDRQRQRRS